MTPNEIRGELIKAGKSMRSIARDLNISPTAVHLVIYRRMVSNRVMEAIASAIGQKKETVFPDYFENDRQVVNG